MLGALRARTHPAALTHACKARRDVIENIPWSSWDWMFRATALHRCILWLSFTLLKLLVDRERVLWCLAVAPAHGGLWGCWQWGTAQPQHSELRRAPMGKTPTTKLNFWENSWLHTGNQSEGGGLLFSKIINSGLYLPG